MDSPIFRQCFKGGPGIIPLIREQQIPPAQTQFRDLEVEASDGGGALALSAPQLSSALVGRGSMGLMNTEQNN